MRGSERSAKVAEDGKQVGDQRRYECSWAEKKHDGPPAECVSDDAGHGDGRNLVKSASEL